jgi:hypothetical protein
MSSITQSTAMSMLVQLRWPRSFEQNFASLSGSSAGLCCRAERQLVEVGLIRGTAVKGCVRSPCVVQGGFGAPTGPFARTFCIGFILGTDATSLLTRVRNRQLVRRARGWHSLRSKPALTPEVLLRLQKSIEPAIP